MAQAQKISKTIDIDSCTLHYLETGKVGDKAVLLLHGMKFNAETWNTLGTLQQLANANYQGIAVDMPGFGESPSCERDPDTILRQFITTAALDRPILVGPSMGGRTCLEFVINHPELIGGLIVIGAVGVPENKDRLGEIKVPTLIVWGSADQISSPKNAELLHTSIAGSRKIIFADSPHPCYLDKPEEWHSALLDFLPTCK